MKEKNAPIKLMEDNGNYIVSKPGCRRYIVVYDTGSNIVTQYVANCLTVVSLKRKKNKTSRISSA